MVRGHNDGLFRKSILRYHEVVVEESILVEYGFDEVDELGVCSVEELFRN